MLSQRSRQQHSAGLTPGGPAATASPLSSTACPARREVAGTCGHWGGDPGKIVLCGFGRGVIARGHIGLHDGGIAARWKAFIPHNHYDGAREWDYPDSDRTAARARLQRLVGRPSFIIDGATGLAETRAYIESTGISAPFTWCPLPFRNHNDAWALRDIPARRAVREWLEKVLNPPEEGK